MISPSPSDYYTENELLAVLKMGVSAFGHNGWRDYFLWRRHPETEERIYPIGWNTERVHRFMHLKCRKKASCLLPS